MSSWWNKFKRYVFTLNLFSSKPPTTDAFELTNERISTKLFIVLFIISMTILLLYTSLIKSTKIVNVNELSFKKYQELYSKYKRTLTCECSKISINYGEFLRVEYTLHQICSSLFVNQSWIDFIFPTFRFYLDHVEFRAKLSSLFQGLSGFCHIINRTISDNLNEFYLRQYISPFMKSSVVVISETKLLMDQFKYSIQNHFLIFLSMIQDTTKANALFSGLNTDSYFIIPGIIYPVTILANEYNSCVCNVSSICTEQLVAIREDNPSERFVLIGFYTGCYIIEGLLQSNLECFFNQECIDELLSYLVYRSVINMTALNSSKVTRYSTNSTIKQLLDNLMIEQWDVLPIYRAYYNECNPIQCTYSEEARNDLIYIITTLFGISGGLITILKILVPQFVKLIRKKREDRQRTTKIIFREFIYDLFPKVKHFILKHNIFPSIPPSTDEHELRNQRISTKLFIVLFTASMTILLLYTSLITITKTIQIDNPSFEKYQQLYSKYEQRLTCPCSQISIRYDKFLNIDYRLHEVCSSIFIDQSWISYPNTRFPSGWFAKEFGVTSSYSFQALNTFCKITNRTISDSLIQFNSNQYINAFVTPSDLFLSEISSLTNQFQSSMKNNLLVSRLIIQNTTQANGLFPELQMHYELIIDESKHYISVAIIQDNKCNCYVPSTCIEQSYVYKYPSMVPKLTVRGFYTGCYIVDSLLQSTLECFYNQQCVDTLISEWSVRYRMNFTALNSSLLNSYVMNTTIEDLLNNLMIENWTALPVYEKYYNECQPIQCSYNVETRNHIIYIITTLFGLAGGLTTILELVVPRLVNIIRRKREHLQATTVINNHGRLTILWIKLKESIKNLNFFQTIPPSTDEHELRNQRISTRLFIVLFTISMTILLLYTSLLAITKTIQIDNPSFEKYQQFYSNYEQRLTCPCSKISISYNKFLDIDYQLHEVCHSIFIDQRWINYLSKSNGSVIYALDFRWTSSFSFQALATLCDLINRTITDSRIEFYSRQYVSASVIPFELFHLETKSLTDQFRSSMTSSFILSRLMVRDTTQANGLFPIGTTKYLITVDEETDTDIEEHSYENCKCVSSSACIDQLGIYTYPPLERIFIVPGFYTGCYAIEALLQSTLECFYDQTCIDKLLSYSLTPIRINVTALHSSLLTSFSPNTTIQDLVDNLMIVQWNAPANYQKYYNECMPIQCTYTVQTKHEAIYIVTTLFGLTGGLTTILNLVVPRLVQFFMSYIQKLRGRVVPQVSSIQTE